MYNKNNETFMRETAISGNIFCAQNWRNQCCKSVRTSQNILKIGGINIVKMSILFKTIYRLNEIPFQVSVTSFTEIERIS